MNSKLPSLKPYEVVSALFKAGFLGSRTKGSHLTMIRAEKRVTVPLHSGRDILPGTLNSILKQAGLTRKEFLRLLHGYSHGV